jgi:hypothetical protein
MKIKLLIFGLLFILSSCEGENGGDGFVFDQNTGIALDSVMYKCIETEKIKYTDSLGSWEMYGPFGGCMPDCPDFHVEFSKEGYETITIKNPDNDIYLEQEE